jgi:peptidyl-prolyl cis-trans isomerase SurA
MTFYKNRGIELISSFFMLIVVTIALPSYAQSAAATSGVDNKIRDIDGVAAVVNTGFVTRKEIDDRVASIIKEGAGGGTMPVNCKMLSGVVSALAMLSSIKLLPTLPLVIS